MPLPQRAGVAVAVTDVQRPGGVHALGDHVDGLDGAAHLVGVAGQEGLVDLQELRALRGERAGLGVEHPRDRQRQLVAVVVGEVAGAAGQRERAGEGELHRGRGLGAGEREVVGEPEHRPAGSVSVSGNTRGTVTS